MCEASDDAYWRHDRLTTLELMQREWERCKKVCPLLAVFGIFIALFKIDWLHCADQGVAADFLGNLFSYLVKNIMPGSNKEQRCNALSVEVFQFYKDNPKIEDTLKEFVLKSFQPEKSTQPPKLKGNAASTRALVPFGHLMAKRYLSDAIPHEGAMKAAADHLWNCYESLREDNAAVAHEALYLNAKKFALQYAALHDAFGKEKQWLPKPKMHMFLELCSANTEPQKFWNYRDEDFGSTVARQSKMKGSWKILRSYCVHAHDMFRMKNSVPRITSDKS